MEELLKEKLWFYIIHNNPDLMFKLQEDYEVLDYLNKKIEAVKSVIDAMMVDKRSKYIIEETCLDMLTEDLKPSRFLYIRWLLLEEFEKTYCMYKESGILTCEVINLLESSKTIFDTIGFTQQNQDDPVLRNALIGQIADYVT